MDELLSRQQPQSLEAEQAVLGSVLIDSRCLTEIVGLVKPEDFYLQQNREIYETIKNVGTYTATCKLGYEITAPLTVKIEEI